MDRNELKIEALRQKISELVTKYEDQAADYRVEITLLTNDKNDLEGRLAQTTADLQQVQAQVENQKAANVEEVHVVTDLPDAG